MNRTEYSLSTLEVAEMVRKKHKNLLADIRNYISMIEENTRLEVQPSEFFIESSYKDSTGRTMPCYLVTKKGCEFIAHKMTGQKGTEFTVRYINRFHEMEHQVKQIPLTEHPGEVARLINSLATIMKNNQSAPKEIAENTKLVCEQYGIRLIDGFVKIPEYEQLELPINFRGGSTV